MPWGLMLCSMVTSCEPCACNIRFLPCRRPSPCRLLRPKEWSLTFLTVCRTAGDVTGGALQQQQDGQPWASQSNPALEQARALLQRQLGSSPGADLH